jgi:hypothetical protein
METVEQWLRGRGCHISRMYRGDLRFLLEAPCNEILDRERPTRPFYVAAERKTQAPLNYKLGHVPVHGLGAWKWERFREVAAPVWWVVAEALTGELLALRVSDEEPDDTFGGGNIKGVDRGGMVYWRKSRFAKLADLNGAPSRPSQPSFGFMQ